MRVVLDTNVIVSAMLSPHGPPAEIIRQWEAEEFEVVTSPVLLAELERALSYPKVKKFIKLSGALLKTWLKRFAMVAVIVQPSESLKIVTADEADNRVLECAHTAEASYLVTGDEHLLDLKEYGGVTILNPAAFLRLRALQKSQNSKPLTD